MSTKLNIQEEQYYLASQWRLMWWKFRRHKLAQVGGLILISLYLLAILAEFITPYNINQRHSTYIYVPPQKVHLFWDKHSLHFYVYGIRRDVDLKTWKFIYTEDTSKKYFLHFFVRGYDYKFLGLIPTNIHLFRVEEIGTIFLFGTDGLGRDLFSRTIYGARVSLFIGLVGVGISLFLGTLIGGISGYYGGKTDIIIQRIIEFLISIPTIPLWMALSAALPQDWSPIKTFFAISIILSLIGWCGVARVVRGKFLELREEDFIMAAKLSGCSEWRIIIRHMVPSFVSYLIVQITLSIPSMILGETALSFLGLGIRPPAVSWGALLKEAQNISAVVLYPWLLIPSTFVIVAVLSFNFLGDGLRDAADPYLF